MGKLAVKLPEGFECDDGTCLEKPLSFKIEVPEVNPVVRSLPDAKIEGLSKPKPMESHTEPAKTEEKVVEVVKKVVPSWQPSYICKGPNCNTKKNPAYAQRPKGKCPNCGQFSKEAFGACIWCDNKELEQVDEEELDNLGIPRPEDNAPETEEVD